MSLVYSEVVKKCQFAQNIEYILMIFPTPAEMHIKLTEDALIRWVIRKSKSKDSQTNYSKKKDTKTKND